MDQFITELKTRARSGPANLEISMTSSSHALKKPAIFERERKKKTLNFRILVLYGMLVCRSKTYL